MIHIGIDPIAFAAGSLEVRWYGIMVALAVLVGITVPMALARREDTGTTREHVLSVAVWAVLGGIIGSRVLHVLDVWVTSGTPGNLFSCEGAAIFGAILGGTLGAAIAAKVMAIPIGRFANLTALGLPLAQATGRIGCLLNGCCYGRSTSLPWATVWTHPNSYGYHDTFLAGAAAHPTQGYELLWDLLVFAIIWLLRRQLRQGWTLYLLYISVYSFGRFVISFLRVNEPFLFGLQQAQVVSLLVLLVAVPLLIYYSRRTPQTAGSATSEGADATLE